MKANNLLYTDIVINLDLLNTWEDKFVSVDIASCILQYEPNISKQEDYAIDLETENFENEFHHLVDTNSLNDSGCLSGCLYVDADNSQKHPTTNLISVLANHKDSGTPINPALEVLLLTYQNKSFM